jgi:transcriptional regulator with XRE-family HTH domain
MNSSREKVTEEMKRLARRLVVLRATRGWSQETLASLAGLHRNYIGHIERSETNIGLINLAKLSNAFGMSVSEMTHGI